MKNYFIIAGKILGFSAISLAVFVLAYLYFPVNIFDDEYGKLGTSLTLLQGSDTIKDGRTIINNALTALNNGKVENTATTFPTLATLSGLTSASLLNTIGTITTGIWHGTIIDVLYGGTGTSTVAANQVVLGNGSSGLKTVASGSVGQLLTLNASGTPAWGTPSIDQAVAYNWTGAHAWASTTNFNGPATFSSTTTINSYPTASTSISNKGYTDTKSSLNQQATSSATILSATTTSGNYYTYDASSIVGSKKALILLQVFNGSSNPFTVLFRRKGDTTVYKVPSATGNANVNTINFSSAADTFLVWTETDSTGKFEYSFGGGADNGIQVRILSFINQ